MKAATLAVLPLKSRKIISIHAAREGGDPTSAYCVFMTFLFQSTPPVKAATDKIQEILDEEEISIHAAREGGDFLVSNGNAKITNFNPRRP